MSAKLKPLSSTRKEEEARRCLIREGRRKRRIDVFGSQRFRLAGSQRFRYSQRLLQELGCPSSLSHCDLGLKSGTDARELIFTLKKEEKKKRKRGMIC